MAKTTVITDDMDGSANARTVSFSLDGRSFEVDLNPKNLAALKAALKPYINAAQKPSASAITSTPAPRRPAKAATRRQPKAATRRPIKAATSAPVDLPAVRAWAAAQGVAVATRGRIAGSVVDAFRKAHS